MDSDRRADILADYFETVQWAVDFPDLGVDEQMHMGESLPVLNW